MRSLVTVFFLITALWADAQSDELIIQGQTGGLYLEHTVAAKETWYSLGRMYNVDPKVLSKSNQLTFARPLVIGQELKIPLTVVNFSQDGKKGAAESLMPVYHIVQEKEWLYRISVNHNKVPIPELEKWNHVTGDQVHAGLHMIVGYLKVKTALSALAKRGVGPGAGSSVVEGGRAGGGTPAVAVSGGDGSVSEKMDTVRSSKVEKAVVDSPKEAVSPVSHFNGGKFKADFSDGGKSVAGQAGIFKSTSGWQDGNIMR